MREYNKLVSFRINEKLLKTFDEAARSQGFSRSALLRKKLEEAKQT